MVQVIPVSVIGSAVAVGVGGRGRRCGVIEGALEIWWKPYHDQGTSAWSRQMLGPGDWIEVEALHCHAVRWHGKGKGVVFKAGPGPLAGVGRLGEKGKTKCEACICMKPREVCELVKK